MFAGKPRKGGFKKRRVARRPVRRSTAFSTQTGSGSGFGFRSKKISRRAWNKKLWDSTLQKSHYRSNGAQGGSVNTATSQSQMSVVTTQAMDNGVGAFWTQGGGCIELNDGEGVPTFVGDIIVRGGKFGIKLFNGATDRPVMIQVWLVKSAPRPTTANLPATVQMGWDPSTVPEFIQDIGKIIFRREFQLETLAEMTIERRTGIMKIDQENWATGAQRFIWIIAAADPVAASAVTVGITTYFNCSFSGDSNEVPP